MSRIPDYIVDQIRERTDIVTFIGKWVTLKKAGKDYWGSCPFHDDTTPSFSVSKKGFFKCFGCGEGGDVIRFLELKGMAFRDAVTYLGQQCGIDVDAEAVPPSDYDPERRARDRERAEKAQHEEQEALWAEIAKKQAARFRRAEPARVDHAYLQAKGVTSAPGIKQEGSDLLIPMRAAETDKALLMSIQTIGPGGAKRFAEGGRVYCTRTVIGAEGFKDRYNADGKVKPTLYICEGWATGWTIWHVTGDPAIVAFGTGGLKPVAIETTKRYPKARVIIAGDNDRWSRTLRGLNPGLIFAREAAEAAGCEYAVPDFEGLLEGEKQTDYNDLWRREGPEQVRRWLDPALVSQAVTEAAPWVPPEVATEAAEVPQEAPLEATDVPQDAAPTAPVSTNGPSAETVVELPQTWLETADFYPIGFDKGIYYYLPKGTGQISAFTIGGHKPTALLSMGNLSWWEHHFGGDKGVRWNTAYDALFRACERSGVYRPERLRGRGCWIDDEGVVLHLGNRLLPPNGKEFVAPETYRGEGDHIYERLPRLYGPSRKRAMDLREASAVLAMFRDLLWIEQASGDLLAGWTVLAPIAGALSWRPHAWMTGSPGSGKTEVLEKLVVPMLGGVKGKSGMAAFYEAGSTEAGIRQELRADALPIIYDEAEKDRVGSHSDNIMQAVLALARSSSSASGSSVVKGSSVGQSIAFQVWSMFLLSSVSAGLRQEQDKSRVSVLQLHGGASIDKKVRAQHWKAYQPRLAEITTTMGRELIARTLRWLRDGRLSDTIKTFKAAASTVLGDTRSGDQYGTLYAGAWTLMSDTPPDAAEAREIVGSADVVSHILDQMPEGQKVLEALLQAGARLEFEHGTAKSFAVGELVAVCRPGRVVPDDTRVPAEQWLNRHGMQVTVYGGIPAMVIAYRSKWVETVLKDTPFGDNWVDALRSVEGVDAAGPTICFHPGLTSRVVVVPLSLLDKKNEEE